MKKETVICFRTRPDIRHLLEKSARKEGRSVSSLIENVLRRYLEKGHELKNIDDKRRYPRKKVSVPSLINGLDENSSVPRTGIVRDISLDGLQLSIPGEYEFEIRENKACSKICIVFTLPDVQHPLTTECQPKHFNQSSDETIIGASFCDVDFASYRAIQKYVQAN